ncbi:MAG: energy-coupling factor transporter transmembrane protein EcfT [Lachnospiraceae bacterium]|nr:energy-coupling factor transporter transmembrane protein EcfT [Lachnospiraceae bacterium]
MLKDITLGQYYPAESILHRMDPRVKIIGTLIYIVSLFVFRSWGFILGTLFLAAVILMSKIPFSYMIKGLKTIFILMLFTMALNTFLTPGEAIWSWKFLHITKEGLSMAGKTGLRLVYLVLGASLMTLTTTPTKLTDAIEKLLKPFRVIKVPAHEIAMMMSIALRFIPILMEETDKIMKAQMARGADFESGGIGKRIKALVPLLVPLFVSAFRRANDLALAMEARCYAGGDGRTQMKPLRYEGRDRIAYVVIWLYLGIAIAVRILLHW